MDNTKQVLGIPPTQPLGQTTNKKPLRGLIRLHVRLHNFTTNSLLPFQLVTQLVLCTSLLYISSTDVHAGTLDPAIGNHGGVGLLQTPNARFLADGGMVVGYSSVHPYNRGFLTIQGLPWLEGTLRYTEIVNRLFGPQSFSGDQTLKDKGIDLKIRLSKESVSWPALAIGLRDIGGTALFGGEYIVASKRYFNFDFSAGIGWGQLGTRGHIKNPLRLISKRFASRNAATGQGGTLGLADWFSGQNAALFAGIDYQTSIDHLKLRVEYDPNNYQNEPGGNNQKVDSPFNFGLNYHPYPWLDLGFGLERGNTLMFQASIRTNLHTDQGLPKFDKPPVKFAPLHPKKFDENTRKAFHNALEDRGFHADTLQITGKYAELSVRQSRFRSFAKASGRIARIATNHLPDDIKSIQIVETKKGIPTNRISLLRKHFDRAIQGQITSEELWHSSNVSSGDSNPRPLNNTQTQRFVHPESYPNFKTSIAPALRQHVGGPDNFYLFQLWAKLNASVEFRPGLTLSGTLGVNLYNNFDQLKLASDSKLPKVRSDIKDYLKEGQNGIVSLQADYLWEVAPNTLARMSAGLFEQMFGGVGGEVVYHQPDSIFGFGAELGWVKQREFDGLFGFRDYSIVTGHLNLYTKLPIYNLLSKISFGRYLAGDIGTTIEISREFNNGTRIGIWATVTNVSAADFGEGSFDKGLFINLPFDVFSTTSTTSRAALAWRPLTRDGGQKVSTGPGLYGISRARSPQSVAKSWREILD